MKTLAALLLVASLASAQGGRFREPEQTTQDLPVAVVATVIASNPATGTNEKPPVVTLEVTEVLKGDLKPGRIDAVWMPQGLYLQCGVGAEEIIAEWNLEPCPGPEAGASLILGLKQDGAAWTALPELRVPSTPEALERTRLEIRDPAKAKEARLDRETAAMVRDAAANGVVINAENLASVLRHVDRMGQVEALTFFEFIPADADLKKLAALPRLAEVELIFDAVTVADIDRLGAALPVTSVVAMALSKLPEGFHAAIARLPKLRELRLPQFAGLDKEQAAAIAASKSLRAISSYSGVLEPGATEALRPLATLESLAMHFRKELTVEDAAALATFPRLKRLDFEFTATTPEALTKLAGLKTLESLSIYCLDDAEIAAVATIGSLRSLRIYDPKVTDDRSLLALAALEGLEELFLSTHIMPAARVAVVEELRGKMKGCKIR